MKKRHAWIAYLSVAIAAEAAIQPTSTVVKRGPDHKVLATPMEVRAPDGKTSIRTNYVTELAAGMHYLHEGQWLESEEIIEPVQGGAVAARGRHTVSFAANLNTFGAIELTMTEQAKLRSHVLALGYTDVQTGARVVIASLKDSIGEIHLPNQVVYRDAFDGASADVRYTWTKNGFEQDVILRQAPIAPADLGLNPETTKFEVFTEFVDGNQPSKTSRPIRNLPDAAARRGVEFPVTTDTLISFVGAKFVRGHAFSANAIPAGSSRIPVGKSWETAENRTFLVEAVSYRLVKPQLDVLPQQAALGADDKEKVLAAKLPQKPEVVAALQHKPMQYASVADSRKGFVMDYLTLGSSYTDFTFTNNVTYYISGNVDLSGRTTLEGGAVLKFGPAGTLTQWDGEMVTDTSLFDPVFLTSKNDNSQGEGISGSTGSPQVFTNAGAYLQIYDGATDLRNIKIAYAYNGISYLNPTNTLVNAQFTHCGTAARLDVGFLPFTWCNVLATDCDSVIAGYTDIGSIEHLTATKVRTLVTNEGVYSIAIALTNVLLVNVTNIGFVSMSSNGYAAITTSHDNVFQTVGAGRHYLLSGSTYRDIGTTNVSAIAREVVRQGTTFPPLVKTNFLSFDTTWTIQAQRDTDLPDLGYHYPPMDYAASYVCVTNATLTIAAGTSIGMFNGTALWIYDGGRLVCDGRADARIQLQHYSIMQEEPNGWGPAGGGNLFINPFHSTTNAPRITLRFADHRATASGYAVYCSDLWAPEYFEASHCKFDGGWWWAMGSSRLSFTNNIISVGNELAIWDTAEAYFVNNLFYRLPFSYFEHDVPTTPYVFKNNLIWCSELYNVDPTLVHTHNAVYQSPLWYDTEALHASEFILTNHTFFTGPLGKFYIATNSPLVNAGSTYATNLGLYHFTTTTNLVKEGTNTVDIGFHYLATDSSGVPIDSDGDGTPDYLEDKNGNGAYDSGLGEADWQTYTSPNSLNSSPALKVYTPLK